MITIFYIANARGWPLTPLGTFDPDGEDVAEFRWEDDAIEELAAHPGCTVETYQRLSEFPDFNVATSNDERAAA